MDWLLLIALVVALGGLAFAAQRRRSTREATEREQALAPVRKLAYEDVTAFGEDLANLDVEIAGQVVDEGARADLERALDAYESAKAAGDSLTEPDDIRRLTGIIDDGRYAIACVRARVAGHPLPSRRPPCYFDPRHGPSVTDVLYAPSGGVERHVPACALDAERIGAGADPDTRKVLADGARVPYWQGGRAFQPYAMGYYGADAISWLFLGNVLADGYGAGGYEDAGGDPGDSGGDPAGFDGGGDF